MILEHEHEYANQSAAIMAIAPKIGCGRDTLRRWVKQSDIDNDRKDGQTSDERAQIKAMEGEIRELRQANEIEIFRKASEYFAQAELACLFLSSTPNNLGCCDDRLKPPNICPFAIPSDWLWQGSSPPSAASVIPMTMS
ncbi:transposase [Yoonia sp. MH D7]